MQRAHDLGLSLTVEEVKVVLTSMVVDLESTGYDNLSGDKTTKDGDVDTADITLGLQQFTGDLASSTLGSTLVYDPATGEMQFGSQGDLAALGTTQGSFSVILPAGLDQAGVESLLAGSVWRQGSGYQVLVRPVPEPGSLVLALGAFLGLLAGRLLGPRRRKNTGNSASGNNF